MAVLALLAIGCLVAAAAVDVRSGRLPNVLLAPALGAALVAYPEPASIAAAILAMVPFLLLGAMREVGMGDAKFAAPVGVLLAGEVGLVAILWWWAWVLLGAAVLQTASGLLPRPLRAASDPVPVALTLAERWAERAPLGPVLLVAALLAAVS